MTKQEEIREVLNTLCCVANAKDLAQSPTGFDEDVEGAMLELDKLGVVIKVDRELPVNPCEKCELDLSRECHNVCMERTQYEIEVKMLKAGYVAVKPLIEEKVKV